MNLEQAEDKFRELLGQIDPAHSAEFILWIQRRYLMARHQVAEGHHKLMQIASYLRDIVPGNAVLPSETIIVPKEDCDPATTVHVDAFLYDDHTIDELVEEGKLKPQLLQGVRVSRRRTTQ
ncbi:hypothetical protein HPB48_001789 [Haemaphysalis longicornis]|uniref:Uncharacterized protein n=1 Tax=Haemaphysalis longicornis TaxID=44386 RepID=A0A9J6GN87_HAELO|nr:hypothetical protein HPB48_001789 [Haemaphysalis longicornis]